jgi:hypothetical protein
MLSFPPAVRIWLALAPADLRKGFDALAELVRQHLRDDPLSGHVFATPSSSCAVRWQVPCPESAWRTVAARKRASTTSPPAPAVGDDGEGDHGVSWEVILPGCGG